MVDINQRFKAVAKVLELIVEWLSDPEIKIKLDKRLEINNLIEKIKGS